MGEGKLIMPEKQCTRCLTKVEYETEEDLLPVFRKVPTRTGEYFRGICRKCEAEAQKERRQSKIRKTRNYVESDYPGALSIMTSSNWSVND